MDNDNNTDSFFFTKHNINNRKSISTSLPSLEVSSARTIKVRKQELQNLFNNYHLFKYSKCFQERKKLSMPPPDSERRYKNFKSIKKQSQKLKDRLESMEKERKEIIERMRNHPK